MNKKTKTFIRVMCWILAALMVASVATTLISFLILSL